MYNLSLVDIVDGKVSDTNVSNNKDMPQVLSTVYRTMLSFFEANPNAKVIFQGSTLSRTRLYRIAISRSKSSFEQKFRIFGYMDENFEPFEKDKNYEAFLIQKVDES